MGNILEVKRVVIANPAPTVSMVSPAAMRRGESKPLTITGTNLTGATVSSPGAAFSISGLQATATQVTFTLTVSMSAPLGPANFTLATGTGSAAFQVTINPEAPALIASPSPLAIPIDNLDRRFFVRLSSADTIDHAVALATGDPLIGLVTPASVTIVAGQIEAEARIRGVAGGTTPLTLSSPGLVTISVPVFVTAEFAGINSATSPVVGVVLSTTGSGNGSSTTTDIVSTTVGVAFGRYFNAMSPGSFVVGTGPTPFTLTGAGLEGVTGITVQPPDGVTISGLSATATTLNGVLTVDATAPTSLRRIVLGGSAAPYAGTSPTADRIAVTLPIPEVFSVEPIFATPGTSGIVFIVRGRNFANATAVTFDPPTGIAVGSAPTINADGTELRVGVTLALNAPVGDRVVGVTTAAGASSATPSAFNTFHVVSAAQTTYQPIVSPTVGVVIPVAGGSSTNVDVTAPSLGVAFGPVASALLPPTQQSGTSAPLTITGAGLQGVNAVEIIPNDGVVLGAVSAAANGTSVSVPVSLAESAPRTTRQVRLRAGALPIAFAPASASQFQITGPLPQVTSVAPQLVAVGSTTTLRLTGANFQNASQVRFVPSAGLSAALPSVSADGTQLSAALFVAGDAAVGPRIVIVTTPAGESSTVSGIDNTFAIYSGAATIFDPIVSPAVGVLLQGGTAASTTIDPIVSPLVGVVLQAGPPPPVTADLLVNAPRIKVSLGPVASSITAPPLNLGGNGTLVVSGYSLTGITAASASPATGITLGSPVPAVDGASVAIPISVAANAPIGPRLLSLQAGAAPVFFIDLSTSLFTVVDTPRIDSLEPILGTRGSTLELIIRGANLQFATAITATPASGITVGAQPVVNATGTELRVGLFLDASAPVGARVIQVVTPGGASSALAAPANTFSVN